MNKTNEAKISKNEARRLFKTKAAAVFYRFDDGDIGTVEVPETIEEYDHFFVLALTTKAWVDEITIKGGEV